MTSIVLPGPLEAKPLRFPADVAGNAIVFAHTQTASAIRFHVTLPNGGDWDSADFSSEDWKTT